jgi:hypothetical protein
MLNFKIDRILISQVLLCLCIAVPYLGIYEMTFLLWVCTFIFSIKKRYAPEILHYLFVFIAIVLLALISSDYFNSNSYFIVRDFAYLIKPVLGLLVGYQLAFFTFRNIFKIILYLGLTISIVHIVILLHALIFSHLDSVTNIRMQGGTFSDFEVYAFVILVFRSKFDIRLSSKIASAVGIVIALSVALYFSRVNFIQTIILMMAMKGYFQLTKKALKANLIIGTILIAFYAVVLIINPQRHGKGIETFLYKVKLAPTETIKTDVNLNSDIEFRDNLRSVEFSKTVSQVSQKRIPAIVFGCGLGSQVDLGRKMWLGDSELQWISILHNSFITIFLKSGIIGVLLLSFSIYYLYRYSTKSIDANSIDLLLMGTAVFMILSNWVLMGYYYTGDSKSIIVGSLFALKELSGHTSACTV